jgi:ABC-type nitrate/sulfonate/bicarbonate transport system ATPase subunit
MRIRISKSYEEKKVFDGLELEIAEGEILGVFGESGVGKTTLLQGLAGLISFDGDVENVPQNIGYIFQEPRLFPWMTALENVTAVSCDEAVARDLLTALELPPDSFCQYPDELSGGMKQRISIARAIAYQPDIMLMDEPFQGLDPNTKKKTADVLFGALHGKTGILITHDANDLAYCDCHLSLDTLGKI